MKTKHSLSNISCKSNHSLPIQIEFGTPSKDCANFGICRVHLVQEIPGHNIPNTCGCSTFGYLEKNETGLLKMIFPRAFLSKKAREKHFANPTFKVEEPYVWTADFVKLLELHEPHIEEGEYPILESEEIFEIYFYS